jgi:phosphatidylinositol alpha 1,6-mannosyltransferase
VISVPGVAIPWDGGYSFGVGLDEDTIRKIEAYKPTCVHFTVPDFVALDGIRWCQRTNTAYMSTWHSNYVDYMKYYLLDWIIGGALHRYMKSFYEQVPNVYVPTPYMLKKMEKEGFGRFTTLKRWGRGCDLKIFRPDRRSQAFRQSKGINPDDVVILWVGRLVPEKRPDIWLYVVGRLQDEGIPVKAMVVGSGQMEASLRDINDLTICGWMSGIALAEAYASCDVLLFPSGVETFGNVTLEALASGCMAVVEEKCSGHLVEDGKNGYTCPDGDFEAYYQATKRAVTDHVNRRKMGEYARESSWAYERTKIMQQMLENYKDSIMSFRDPSYIKRYLAQDPEAAGENCLATMCCNYWFTKTFAGPFLRSSVGVQNVYYSAQDCVNHSSRVGMRMSCSSLASLDYSSLEGRWRDVTGADDASGAGAGAAAGAGLGAGDASAQGGSSRPSQLDSTAYRFMHGLLHYGSILVSYFIVLLLLYASVGGYGISDGGSGGAATTPVRAHLRG